MITFGFDGLYSGSKISLKTLSNRWSSEDWGTKLTICGAIIGWTRGTGLISANKIIAEGIEKVGVRTLSQKEMACNILGLMTPSLLNLCQEEPIMADLNGGLQNIHDLKEFTTKLRTDLLENADIRRAVSIESSIEQKVINGDGVDANYTKATIQPRSNMLFSFPEMKSHDKVKSAAPDLEDMLDLNSVIVVTGFSEVSSGSTSEHVLDEISVARSINDSDVVLRGFELPQSNVNGETSFSRPSTCPRPKRACTQVTKKTEAMRSQSRILWQDACEKMVFALKNSGLHKARLEVLADFQKEGIDIKKHSHS